MSRSRSAARRAAGAAPARLPAAALASLRVAALVWWCAAALATSADAQGIAPAEAHVDRTTLSTGENLTLEVSARGNVTAEPQFDVPPGLEMLGSSSSHHFSWANGRSLTETIFHYELDAAEAGHYSLGPFRVGVGGARVIVPAIEITVLAAPTSVGVSAGRGPAALLAEVSPSDPCVGQPVELRVRLVLRAPLAEDPQYSPPATPGFWSEAASQPVSFYAAEGSARVLVTETRTRLYPLAGGTQTIGEATARLALLEQGTNDASRFSRSRVPRAEVEVHSPPVRVHVRALPAGAPPGFGGAVGELGARWSCDRSSTARDVPATVELEVRGTGNLPLIHPPTFESADFEVFAASTDDSLGAPGQAAAGRRTFRWTVLPRREGALVIPPPVFAWFDPAAGTYRSAALAPLALQVGKPLRDGAASDAAFPPVFSAHPLHPFGVRFKPWAWAVAGLLIGAAIVIGRRGARLDPTSGRRDEIRALRAALAASGGAVFWKRAEETLAFLGAESPVPPALRERIGSARYSSTMQNPAPVRRELDVLLASRLPRSGAVPRRAIAFLLILAACGAAVFGMGRPGPDGPARDAAAADGTALAGDPDRAHDGWLALWKSGARDAGLAARLAWYEIRGGDVAPAAAWVLAGEGDEARDPALGWVSERVREAGGLAGEGSPRWPVRRSEWAFGAALFALAAVLMARRGALAIVSGLLALACAFAVPAQELWTRGMDRAVVRTPATLEGTAIELEPGEVVRITGRDADRLMVSAGPGASGWVPASAVFGIGELQ